MKNPLLLIAFSCFLIFNLVDQQLLAQDTLHHPEKMEVGLRMTNLNLARSSYGPSTQGTQKVGFELFALKSNARNNFHRVGIGYTRDASKSTSENVSNSEQQHTENRSDGHLLTYELGWGHLFKRSIVPFWDRFRLQAGISFAGISTMRQTTHYELLQLDSAGAFAYSQTLDQSSRGNNVLRLAAFGQLGFRLYKGCFLGGEWRVGPSLTLGRVYAKQTTVTTTPTQTNSATQESNNSYEFKFDWRRSIGGPTLFVSFAF